MIRINDDSVKNWERCNSCLKEEVRVHLSISSTKYEVSTQRLCSDCLEELAHMLQRYMNDSVEEWEKR